MFKKTEKLSSQLTILAINPQRFLHSKLSWHLSSSCTSPSPPLYLSAILTSYLSTGVTGYIAGDAFHRIYNKHPEYEYALLIRTKEKADLVQKQYPSVRVVLGGLDDYETIKTEASKADIVLRTIFPPILQPIEPFMLIYFPQTLLMLQTTKVPAMPSPLVS